MNILKRQINIKREYLMAFVIFNFLIVGLYYAYGIFIMKQLKDDITLLTVNSTVVTMTSSDLIENKNIKVPAKTIKNITLSVNNNATVDKYFRIVHEGVQTGVAVYETNADNSSYGLIAGSTNKNVFITINNTTDGEVDVNFKCRESSNQLFDKEINDSFVNVNMNFDHSGAYKPVLSVHLDEQTNMIPVYYDKISDTEGTWKKANVNNADSLHIWYDYDNYMWANVVTVTSEKRTTYLNAKPGTEIPISDINAFFVWIPAYKYYINSSDANTSMEKLINVSFISKFNMGRKDIDNDGTISCIESISTESDRHLYSEICTDAVYENVYNNLSTYVHPSFDGANGIWVSKFMTRNKSDHKILPNVDVSFPFGNISNSEIRKMQAVNNIYGFPIDNGTTYDTATWNYSIRLDLDIYPMTSMDWGAVAILANSQYGKAANLMYQTNTIKSFTRIYDNKSSYYTGRSTYYTTSSTSVNLSSTNTVYYNDLTNVTHSSNSITYPIGYRGAGASTTGTIYGIYDMAGGCKKVVMGIFMNPDGSVPSSMTNVNPTYYTAYSHIPYKGILDNQDALANLSIFKLGDGIREHVRTISDKGMWQDGRLTLGLGNYMFRGGNYDSNGSLFTVDVVDKLDANMATFAVLKFSIPK